MEVGPELSRGYPYFLMSFEPDHTEDSTSSADVRNPMGQNIATVIQNHPIGWSFFSEQNIVSLQAQCDNASSYFQLEPLMKKVYMGKGVKWELNHQMNDVESAVKLLNEDVVQQWTSLHAYSHERAIIYEQLRENAVPPIVPRPIGATTHYTDNASAPVYPDNRYVSSAFFLPPPASPFTSNSTFL